MTEISKMNNIEKLISKYDVISFDIYDTLIVRYFSKPIDVFKFIEMNEGIDGFFCARINAEKKARRFYKKEKEDITINDIYSFINDKYNKFIDIEKNYEIKYTNKYKETYEIYKIALKLNKKIIFTTDMYLDRNTILQILLNNGYDKFDKLYISGEIGLTKRTGNLFKYLLKDLNISSNSILHFGDDDNNDIKMSTNCHISNYKIENLLDKFLKDNHNKKFLEFYKKNKHDMRAGLLVSFFSINNINNNFDDFFYYIGYYLGGLVASSYIKFINNESTNKDGIIFVARDGYLLKKFYDKTYNDIPTYYVNAQRVLNITSSIQRKHIKYLLRIVSKPLDIILPKNKYLLHFLQFFIFFKHKKEIMPIVEQNLKEYEDYINKLNIIGKNILSIDMISSEFTSQLFLQRILKNKTIQGIFFSSSKKDRHKNSNIFIPRKLFFKKYDIYRLIEYLFTSPEPPIAEIKDGKCIYKQIDSSFMLEQQKRIKSFEKGINDFFDKFDNKFKDLRFPTHIINDFIYKFIEFANNYEIENYKKCSFDDGNVTNEVNCNLYEKIKNCMEVKNEN